MEHVSASDAPLAPLSQVIRELNLHAKKSLGQHFLTDTNLLSQIAASAGDIDGIHVLEIGPGPGGLTRALLASHAASITVIEKDSRFLEALTPLQAHYPNKLHITQGDALKLRLRDQLPAPRCMIANLPYNIGTELIVRMLHDIAADGSQAWRSITALLQTEVAQRFCAVVGDDAYGRLSVLTRWLCEASIVRHVPPGAFSPPPKVQSAVLHLRPRDRVLAPASLPMLERVVAAAFNQRRKMLRVSLKSLGVDAQALCEAAGIDATRRAETLHVEEFCTLARCFEEAATLAKT